MQPEVLTPVEVAEWFKVPVRTVLRLLRVGELKGVKVGKVWRIHRTSVEEYLDRVSNK